MKLFLVYELIKYWFGDQNFFINNHNTHMEMGHGKFKCQNVFRSSCNENSFKRKLIKIDF